MKIWIIDHYSVPVKYYPLARNTNFAKNLIKLGHEVIIFAASTVHNSTINLIEDSSEYKEIIDDGVKYVVINCHHYSGNGIKRILNMFEFALKLPKVCDLFEKPDAIVSTSMTPIACAAGLRIGEKYGCKKIAQITDLWPESIVAYGVASKNNPAVIFLRQLEKWIYKTADKIVFSMAGGYDYIKEQGWQNEIPQFKVHYINNGIDLAHFDYYKFRYTVQDEDLADRNLFKVVYAGSIRRVNNLGKLLDAAKLVTNSKVKFLIWGNGDELPNLKERILKENIKNVVFKGQVDKKYVPYITSKASLNIVHGNGTTLLRFGISSNKLFDYLAAGVPILFDFYANYNPVIIYKAGLTIESGKVEDIAIAIDTMSNLSSEELVLYGQKAREGAKEFDFKNLTNKLLCVINSIKKGKNMGINE